MQRQADHTTYLRKTSTMVWIVHHLPQDSLNSAPATSISPVVSSGLCVAALIGVGKALTSNPRAEGGLNIGGDSELSWIGTLNRDMAFVSCYYFRNYHCRPELWIFVLIFFKCVKWIAQIKPAFPLTFQKKKKSQNGFLGISSSWLYVSLADHFFLLIASVAVVCSNRL